MTNKIFFFMRLLHNLKNLFFSSCAVVDITKIKKGENESFRSFDTRLQKTLHKGIFVKKMHLHISLLILILFSTFNLSFAQDLPQQEEYLEKGMVVDIVQQKHDSELEKIFMSDQIVQTLKVKILSGEFQNKEFNIENYLTSNPAFDINLKKGDRVLLEMDNPQDSKNINITSKDNTPIILILVGFFALSLMLIGGYKGMKALFLIIFTISLIFFGLIPLVLNSFDSFWITVGVATILIFFTTFIFGGINIKSISASLGSIFSLILAGFLSKFIIYLTALNGISSQEALALWDKYPKLNFHDILASTLILGTVGAVTYTSMSIANCINEIKKSREDYGFKELFHSGMNVGKDIIGPMINILIFVYLAGLMPLLLLSFDMPFVKFLNFSSVIAGILAILVGSIAIIYCVPITSAISAWLICKFTDRKSS